LPFLWTWVSLEFFLKQNNLVLKIYRTLQTQRLNEINQLIDFIEYFFLIFPFLWDIYTKVEKNSHR